MFGLNNFPNFPHFAKIMLNCTNKIKEHYPIYNNSWESCSSDWFIRLMLKEMGDLCYFVTFESKQKSLENIINWACMMWTNIERKK